MNRDEIYIHFFKTDRGPIHEDLLGLLPWDERLEYGSFELDERRREYLWSRLLLRGALASYLGKPMRDLQFGTGAQGKPYLKGEEIEFNLSHTEGLMACVFGHRPMGIDVERMEDDRARDWESVARRHFSDVEKEYLFTQQPGTQRALFLRIFTMKEALVKAEGTGLKKSFTQFTVPLPLKGQGAWGPWDYVTGPERFSNLFWALVVENQDRLRLKYRSWTWDEGSLEAFLHEHPSIPTEGHHVHFHR